MEITEARKILTLALRKSFSNILRLYLSKKRGFWEVLEQIRALYANKDDNSYIRVAFRELHSEKKYSDNGVRKILKNL